MGRETDQVAPSVDDERECRQAYDDFYPKIRAEVGYDHWSSIWRFIAKRQASPTQGPDEEVRRAKVQSIWGSLEMYCAVRDLPYSEYLKHHDAKCGTKGSPISQQFYEHIVAGFDADVEYAQVFQYATEDKAETKYALLPEEPSQEILNTIQRQLALPYNKANSDCRFQGRHLYSAILKHSVDEGPKPEQGYKVWGWVVAGTSNPKAFLYLDKGAEDRAKREAAHIGGKAKAMPVYIDASTVKD